ncbi:MAG TPA: hypothetical protein VGO26_09175 [Amnibacterium sp.]|jgi:hypothetical protein|nr:hypothetical protein [Amnibacterium sp.]
MSVHPFPAWARRVIATAVVAGVCLGTAGCSPAYSPSGRLAQSASDASAQTQTAALTLRLAASQQLPSPATDTALSDVTDKLGQDDSSLTSADVSGRLDAARRRILDRLRVGEDLLVHARVLVGANAGAAETEAVARRLQATAKQLSTLGQQLQASG